MRREINDDNLYAEGTVISAKVDPALKLTIMKYRQRIYYCSVVDHPEQNKFTYFEKELIPPTGQQVLFWKLPTDTEKNYVLRAKTYAIS
jgi:hypothetical protein